MRVMPVSRDFSYSLKNDKTQNLQNSQSLRISKTPFMNKANAADSVSFSGKYDGARTGAFLDYLSRKTAIVKSIGEKEYEKVREACMAIQSSARNLGSENYSLVLDVSGFPHDLVVYGRFKSPYTLIDDLKNDPRCKSWLDYIPKEIVQKIKNYDIDTISKLRQDVYIGEFYSSQSVNKLKKVIDNNLAPEPHTFSQIWHPTNEEVERAFRQLDFDLNLVWANSGI